MIRIIAIVFTFLPTAAAGRGTLPDPRSFDRLLDAIAIVESGNNPQSRGDGGKAVGAYQLWKIYTDDANRIAGTKYTYADRLCPKKSREMVRIVLMHYGKDVPFDKWAVIHIDPSKRKDWSRPAAQKYLKKINEAMKCSSRRTLKGRTIDD